MTVLTKRAVEVFAPTTAGGALRGADMAESMVWGTEVERSIEGAAVGRVDQATWAGLAAIPGTRAGQPAIVYGPDAGTHTDPVTGAVVPNIGEYYWSASPAGWRRVGNLQRTLVHALNTGAGTPNAVQATSDVQVNQVAYSALITVNFVASNTGAMTLSINGETPRALVTNTGASIPSGYFAAGMSALIQIDSDGKYRLFSYGDASAIQALIEAMLLETEAARDATLAALSSVTIPMATVALAMAHTPSVNPDYYDIAYYDAAYQPGSGARYRKAGSAPTHSGKFQNGNGAWYEIAEPTMRPEMFGRIGVNSAGDTAAWVAMASVSNARGGVIKIRAEGDRYLIQGSAIHFTNAASIWFRLGEETEFEQKAALSQTVRVTGVPTVKVTGGRGYGYALTQIALGQTPNEVNFAGSSYNGVAAFYFTNCEDVTVRGFKAEYFAGGCLTAFGSKNVRIDRCDITGLGPAYNRPDQDGHQGNGGDSAIYIIPIMPGTGFYDPATTTAWVQELEVTNCKIKWHSFGIRTILNNAFVTRGNRFGFFPGQHAIYDSDSDGHDCVGNIFEGCRQIAYKMQFENRAGTEYGPTYNPNHPGYQVGDVVRAFSILYVCKTAYVPAGAAFSATNWNVHPRFRRRGGVWSGNIIRDCGTGIGIIAASPVDGRNIWSEGYVFKGNAISDTVNGLYLQRCWKASVEGNNIQNAQIGIFGSDFCGTVAGNDIWTSKQQAINLSISAVSHFSGNKYWNCGLQGTTDDTKCPVVLRAPDVTSPPQQAANPRVFFSGNDFMFAPVNDVSATDAAGPYLVMSLDPRLYMSMTFTGGTPTTKKCRVDGAVVFQLCNHFGANGFANTAQNEPKWNVSNWTTQFTYDANGALSDTQDVLATIMSILTSKRLISTNI